jgi:hypothetical protein
MFVEFEVSISLPLGPWDPNGSYGPGTDSGVSHSTYS